MGVETETFMTAPAKKGKLWNRNGGRPEETQKDRPGKMTCQVLRAKTRWGGVRETLGSGEKIEATERGTGG